MKLKRIFSVCLLSLWWVFLPLNSALAEDIIINLDATTAYVDTVVVIDTTTAYVITTTTGPRTEVVDSVTVERVAWVDSWVILYRGGLPETRTVISQDDDSNSTTNNFWASRLSGIATPDTYTIRATSFEYITADQRPVGTYTLSSNLIPPQVDTSTATPTPSPSSSPLEPASLNQTPTPVPSPSSSTPEPTPTPSQTPIPQPQPEVQVQPEPTPSFTPLPIVIIDLPTLDQTPPTEILLPIEEPLVVEPVLVEPPVVEPQDIEVPIQQEIDNQVQENQSIEPFTTSEVLENISQDLYITPTEASVLVSMLMSDGIVSNLEATNLIEALSVGGELTRTEENLIIAALSADGEITQNEVNNLSQTLASEGGFTSAERELVAEALIASAEGQPVTVGAIAEAGIEYKDLPDKQPIELVNGVVLVAEVVVALELFSNPAELVTELFSDPAMVLTAFSNIGADMSPEVREEAEDAVVAAVIVSGIATQASMTAAIGSAGYRRKL